MGATADQIAELRRMISEPTPAVYTDDLLTTIIERYPKYDELGTPPYYWDTSTTIPTKVAYSNWIEGYCLQLAAADIWQEKAAAIAALYDFSADGGSYQRSQGYQQAVNMANYYRARGDIRTIRLIKSPAEPENVINRGWIGNLAEEDD